MNARQGLDRLARALGLVALLAVPPRAVAAPIELVSADASGATLRFTLPAHTISSITRPEGTFWRIHAPGLTGSVGPASLDRQELLYAARPHARPAIARNADAARAL